jgi:hypothetical protein
MTKFIIVHGDIAKGMSFIGPFEDGGEAQEYAEMHCIDEWMIVTLIQPEKEETGAVVFTGSQEGRTAEVRKADDGYAIFLTDATVRVERYGVEYFTEARTIAVTWLVEGRLA